MEIVNKSIDDIKPYEKNPRKNDEAVKYVANSIKEFGFKVPIVIDKDGVIVAGHTRYKASKKLGLKEVPCIIADDLNEDQIKAFRLADNKVSELAEWDFPILNEELENLDIDMEQFGFEDLEIEEEQEIIEDEVPEAPEEPKAKLGDIYQLGNHRLMCGDSTKEEDVAKLMNGVKADMVFTDPPYGVSASGGRSQTKDKLGMKAIANDELRNNDLTKFLSDFIKVMKYKDGASIYICYPWATQKEFTEAILNNNLKIKNCIIWDKKVFGLNGFKGYRPQYEMIYFCCKEDFEWYGDKAQSNIWQISREINREEQGNHPTPKPIELIAKALNNSSKQEDIILDVFGGSGSTLIACEQLNRKCYMMELDPHYIDVIIQRWENFTGQKAVKINE
jgi:site-specific DNA-methyltransferase (adenine-specific)